MEDVSGLIQAHRAPRVAQSAPGADGVSL